MVDPVVVITSLLDIVVECNSIFTGIVPSDRSTVFVICQYGECETGVVRALRRRLEVERPDRNLAEVVARTRDELPVGTVDLLVGQDPHRHVDGSRGGRARIRRCHRDERRHDGE